MTLIATIPTLVRIECDKRDCAAVLVPHRSDLSTYGREVYELIEQHGWSIWVSRSRRFYCDVHGPSKGSKMRRVTW